jgi:hypothetical protein
VLLDQVGKLEHEGAAVGRRQVAPGGVVEGFAGCFDGEVDVVSAGGVDTAYFLLIAGSRLGLVRVAVSPCRARSH